MNLPEIFKGRQKLQGFTLIELMLVVSLVLTLTLVVSTAGVSYYQSQLLRDTADSLISTLREAQGFALAGKHTSAFGVRITDNSYVVFEGDSYESRLVAADVLVPIAGDILVTGPQEIVFSPFSGTTTSEETIVLSLGNRTESIAIAENGYIQ